MLRKIIFLICIHIPLLVFSQNKILGNWVFWPDYSLEGRAENYPGFKPEVPIFPHAIIRTESQPLVFHNEKPTERITNLLKKTDLPKDAFTIELWVKYHVNKPVGALATLRSRKENEEPAWLIGFYNDNAVFIINSVADSRQLVSEMKYKKGFKKYWTHLVGVCDGESVTLYKNGKRVDSVDLTGQIKKITEKEFELAAYMQNEPYMQFANLVKVVRLYNYALSPAIIQKQYKELQTLVIEGKLYKDKFHYTAGPYLNYATLDQINVLWETDRPAKARIDYGITNNMDKTEYVETPKRLQEVKLTGLEPATRYFYRITSTSDNGNKINSGVLTFITAVDANTAFSFAAFGDTEARPHINNKIAEAVWDKRPNFAIVLGDLSDGGTKKHRFEWTHEYFVGITQVASRIPFFPVAGNGEGDLYWYEHYHSLPEPEAYYKFTYGNADFFMLNSNARKNEFREGGRQYKWLEEQLANSKATWKFVVHHHPPYTSDQDDYGDTWETAETNWGDLDMRQIIPLYEKYNVDIVFYGHLHSYERSWPIKGNKTVESNGVIYIQSGGAGGDIEDHAPTPAWFNAKKYRGHHYALVNINKDRLLFNMFDIDGRMQDSFELTKGRN